jgi:hypothetical protein
MHFPRLPWSAVLTLAILMAMSACTVAENSSTTPDEWEIVEVGDIFSLAAPPGTLYHEGSGADSIVGTIAVQDLKLSFDYGVYSDPLNKDDFYKNYELEETQIDGIAARIVTAYNTGNNSHLIGVHFPNIKESLLGSVKLTIYSSLESEENYDMVEKIFRTIKLKEKK